MPFGTVRCDRSASVKRIDHARDEHQPADPVIGDGRKQQFDLKAVDHHHCSAAQKRRQRMIGRCHVEHRRPRDEGVMGRDTKLGCVDQRPRDHRPMGDDSAFRQTGGAAGVENDEPILGLGCDRRRRSGVCRNQPLIFLAETDRPHRGGGRTDIRREIRLDDQQLRRHQIDAIGELARQQTPIEACRDDAEIRSRKLDLEVLRPVARQHRHAITARETVRGQHRTDTIDAIQQLAIADPAIPVLDCGCRTADAGPRAKQRAHGVRAAGCSHQLLDRNVSHASCSTQQCRLRFSNIR